MISLILPAVAPVHALAQILAQLVPAAVDGLVKEVVIAGVAEPGLDALIEDSGARFVAASGDRGGLLAAGAAVARGDWILALDPSRGLPEAWRGPVEAHLAGGAGAAALLVPAGGLLARLTAAPLGLLVRRLDYAATGGFAGHAPEKALAGRLKARRVQI
ncbi:cell wall biosynthesis glycosyltransferase [Caulobacter endophyticus]|uniref:cell wall biosynthesis glycosyltransferase n=1 Tax=Caulobacter endophyticus TaxID=2172652 RepID=UPI00240FC31D|nr:cell wall biosynthesis glycosyltransferase [Caulobacter endophyticus]MDG2527469.1 cell wall biosynthesis glycosyltransferase [Caulobacter endophyticus]